MLKRSRSRSPAAATAAPTTISEQFSKRGFCVVEGLLGHEHIATLRRECDALKARLESRGGDLIEEQCVLDVPPQGVPAEGDAARTSAPAYMLHRGLPGAADSSAAARRTLAELILQILPTAAADALAGTQAERSRTCLFNEHYVVKPKRIAGPFAWHTDGALQVQISETQPRFLR